MPQYAVLDLGSYNFHLLIAEFDGLDLHITAECKEITELASGLDGNNLLSQEKITQTCHALKHFAERLNTTNNKFTRVIGTGALRQASNAQEFINQAEKILSCKVDIISGEQEAAYTFLGTCYDLKLEQNAVIIDIGGGSSEIIIGQHQPIAIHSMAVGGLAYANQFFPRGLVSQAHYRQALQQAREQVGKVSNHLCSYHWDQVIGASGIIRSIKTIVEQYCHSENLTLHSVENLVELLVNNGSCDFIQPPQDSSIKAHLLPGGLVILQAIMLELNLEQLEITDKSVREGVIYAMHQEKTLKVQYG